MLINQNPVMPSTQIPAAKRSGSKPRRISFINFSLLSILVLFFSLANSASASSCQPPAVPGVNQLLAQGATLASNMQTDFGRLQHSSACYLEVWPVNTSQVAALVKTAYANNVPIRTQGASHSENGSSLPHQFELLIHTARLNTITFEKTGTVTVGTGIPVALVKDFVARHSSFFMPVSNDGGVAPTVGGYISAGGIGLTSDLYSGFWEHVNSITLVTGSGKIVHIKKHDPIFQYIFGSMGQLGIMTEAVLNLLPNESLPFNYPLGESYTIRYPTTNGYYWTKPNADQSIYWFNLFASPEEFSQAKSDLENLENKYPQALKYRPIYIWKVIRASITPPLVYDKPSDFYAIGIWGNRAGDSESMKQLQSLAMDFDALVFQKKYRRYIQTEISASPELYKRYYSRKTYTEFLKIKSSLDPKFLFNQRSFFK
jgi:hypothetical protein